MIVIYESLIETKPEFRLTRICLNPYAKHYSEDIVLVLYQSFVFLIVTLKVSEREE